MSKVDMLKICYRGVSEARLFERVRALRLREDSGDKFMLEIVEAEAQEYREALDWLENEIAGEAQGK